ncbi:MaoC family dehydratase N-terminal domain-containing protein [Rhodococcus sp. D-6]|uniref:MaoC family dehydratase N-terminal domain-containing protein n=1 Tax=Rhodococcus sp. D-6 TaxID=1387842 RepID=A0AAU7UYH1_9NOCA|nr:MULTISPECIES: MaoC family dehydratase N-terminal domain-containing protein [Rhodococcus]MCT7291731.1 MaoC family dehydratase N-terminal domain-containing protein [Rhodococcus sp. PAE-6]
MRTPLDIVHERVSATIGTREHRDLGSVRPAEAVAFARACAEDDPRYLEPNRPDFAVHPMYVPSLLRGPSDARDEDYRPDGMFADEVPGTSGLDVRLMAGGQDVDFHRPTPLGERIGADRVVDRIEWKGGGDARFLLITVVKTYRAAAAGALATVTERFIVR